MIDEYPKRRRWFQFRLRTLLVAVLVLCLPLSWLAVRLERARRQSRAAESIRQLHGEVCYEWEPLTSNQRSFMELEEPETPEWIRKILGEEFSNVVAVTLRGPDVHESDLNVLKEFPNLRSLEMIDTPLNDAGVNHISGLTSLRSLILNRTGITPEHERQLHGALPDCAIATVTPLPARR